MTIQPAAERRRRRLATLCERDGGVTAVAKKAGVNAAALDQVLKGVLLPPKADGTRTPRSLGDTTAKAIELAYGLPPGWLDSDDPAPAIHQAPTEDLLKMLGDIARELARRGPSGIKEPSR